MSGTIGEGVLVVGPGRAQWPEPLGGWVEGGRMRVRAVANLHEAAVVLASGQFFAVRGILLDPTVVNAAQIRLVPLLSRRVRLPVVMLPLTEEANPSAKNAGHAGVLLWEDGCDLIATRAVDGAASVSEVLPCEPVMTVEVPVQTEQEAVAMPEAGGDETGEEKGMILPVEARYDEVAVQPLLSDEELQALLGTAE